ncbi:hypothetical protein [Actinomadura napierensis]|uniref:hypothetical protein n=1 Tax=Actinomadura napierensis TaxID=267854 RepID=UPI0031DF11FE
MTEGVRAVQDAWSSREAWVYECLCCETTWDEVLEVRHVGDGHGNEAVIYQRNGQPCTTPWTDCLCPKCQSRNVKAWAASRKAGEIPPARDGRDVAMVFHLRRIHAW